MPPIQSIRARRFVRFLAPLLLFACLAVLSACGGGGGGGDDDVVNQAQANSNWDTLVWDRDDWQ